VKITQAQELIRGNKSAKIPLNSIYFSPTKYCNLKCSHCWVAPPFKVEPVSEDSDLNLSEIQSMYREALALGLKFTKLTGGEPLLRKDIVEIIKIIHGLNIGLHLETNAVLINDDIAKVLGEVRKSDKNFFMAVSLDGNESEHEKQRRVKGCFNKTLNGIETLLKYNIQVQVIFSLSKNNMNVLADVAQICKGYKARSLKINFINNIERGEKLKEKDALLTVREILDFNREVVSEMEEKYSFPVITNLPPVFKKIPKIREGGTCGIFGVMGVLSDGAVSMCNIANSTPELIAGNIRQNSLKELWENGEVFIKLRNEIPRQLEGICSKCILKSFCLGECRADAYYKTKCFKKPFSFCQESFECGLFPEKWLIETIN